MLFANPIFLLALFTLAIPVLIHFFNFRKFKKVYFTNVAFLKEIQQETKKQSQLKQLLILLARLLALTALVIAFAQPYLPNARMQAKKTTQQVVCLYIDNSYSMESVNTEGPLLNTAKTKAWEIASAYSPSTLFQVTTNDFEGRHHQLVSQEELRKWIEEIQITPVARTLPEIINRINNVTLEKSGMIDAYLISDFQKTTMTLAQSRPDTLINWFLIPLKAEKNNNLYIDSIFFQSPVHQPQQPVKLHVRIRNSSAEKLEKVPLKLIVNSVQKAVAGFSVESGSSTEVIMNYTENSEGIQFAQVELMDYPVLFDDRMYFSYQVNPAVSVASVSQNGESVFLNALFGTDSAFRYTNFAANQLNFSTLLTNSTIILNGPDEISSGLKLELLKFINGGGSLVIFPPKAANLQSYNQLLSECSISGYGHIDTTRQRVSQINTNNEVYVDVFEKSGNKQGGLPENLDLPSVSKHFTVAGTDLAAHETLLGLEYGHPFLSNFRVGKGKVYLFYSPLDASWSNLPKHVIFVPTLFKIALLSAPVHSLYYLTGSDETIEIPFDSIGETEIYKMVNLQSKDEIIPQTRNAGSRLSLNLHNQVTQPGLYRLTDGKKSVTGLAFNIDRKESDLSTYSVTALEDIIKRLPNNNFLIITEKKRPLTQEIKMIRQGTPVWKFFIILSLLFLLTEILLIRLLPRFSNRKKQDIKQPPL